VLVIRSETYDRVATDVFAVQDEMARAVVGGALKPRLFALSLANSGAGPVRLLRPLDVAEEGEGLRFPEATRLSIPDGVPPELDEARLLRVQLQRESPKPSGEVPLEPLGVLAMDAPGADTTGSARPSRSPARRASLKT
jgi:hypothetical protein